MNTANTTANGACFCGNVSYTVQLPVLWHAHCHCTMCRRVHGAAFVTWFGVAEGQYTLDQRDVIWYQSSPEAERGRCRHCASQLFFRSTVWPGELHIASASLTTPIDIKPQAHVYYADKVDWLEINDALPKFDSLPSQSDAQK